MKISLKVDYDGEPYIVLLSDKPALAHTEQCVEAEMLEFFIREAKRRGLKLINESDMITRDDYASIRLNEKEEKL